MFSLEPADYDSYSNARQIGLPAGNRYLNDSPLNEALGASGGARRRRRRTSRKHRKSAKKGGRRHRKSHRKSRRHAAARK